MKKIAFILIFSLINSPFANAQQVKGIDWSDQLDDTIGPILNPQPQNTETLPTIDRNNQPRFETR